MNIHENTEIYSGKIAGKEVTQNIHSGAAICAGIGRTIHRRTTYIDPRTKEIGIARQILAGRPGSKWNKFYAAIIGLS